MCIEDLTSIRDEVFQYYINGCKPYFTSQFCKIELDLKSTSYNLYSNGFVLYILGCMKHSFFIILFCDILRYDFVEVAIVIFY